MSCSIESYLQQQFVAHQVDDELPAATRAARMHKELSVLTVNDGFAELSVASGAELESSSSDVLMTELLVHYLEAAWAVDVAGKSDAAAVVSRVLELVAALGTTLGGSVLTTLVARCVEGSAVLLERVRSWAVRSLGWIGTNLPVGSPLLLDVVEALIPRLTDKSTAVRGATIVAAGQVLHATFNDQGTKCQSTEWDELYEAMLWNVWHDPSVGNRSATVSSLPAAAGDHLLARLRDTKEKVRVAAAQTLRSIPLEAWSAVQVAEIVKSGLSVRCQATKDEICALLCTHWCKQAKFNVIQLLESIDVVAHEDEARQLIQVILDAIHGAGEKNYTSELSAPEIRAFQACVQNHLLTFADSTMEVSSEHAFLARMVATTINSAVMDRDTVIQRVVPDMGIVCNIFQTYSVQLMQALEAGDADMEDRACFICLQLLQLATVAGLAEEGSRRRLASLLQTLLAQLPTPDELVEAALQALRRAHNDSEVPFLNAVSEILGDLQQASFTGEDGGEMSTFGTVRILSILSNIMEHATPSAGVRDLLQSPVASKVIVQAVSSTNALVKEAGVCGLGKMGLYTDESVVLKDYKPLLLPLVANSEETLEIRSQALMALVDWGLLFSEILQPIVVDDGTTLALMDLLRDLVQSQNPSAAAIAAEAAAKLLFAGRICESDLLGNLLVLFFSGDSVQVEEDTTLEVGSRARVQQLLSLFFPAYAWQSRPARDALLGSIEGALSLAVARSVANKRKKGTTAVPLVKLVEYVCEIVAMAEHPSEGTPADEQQSGEQDDIEVTATTEDDGNGEDSSEDKTTALKVALQLAQFLSSASAASLTVTQLRGLCKLLGSLDVVDEKVATNNNHAGRMMQLAQLGQLQEAMEEIGMVVTDNTALRAVNDLTAELADVDLSSLDAYEDDANASVSEDPGSDASTITETFSTGDTTVEDTMMGVKENSRRRSSRSTKGGRPSEVSNASLLLKSRSSNVM